MPIADSAADDADSVSSLSTIRLSQFWVAGLTRSPRYSQQVSRNEKVTETYRNCIVQSYFKLLFTFLTRVGVSCYHLHMTNSSQVVLHMTLLLAQEGWQSPPRHHYDDMECDSASIIKCCEERSIPWKWKVAETS